MWTQNNSFPQNNVPDQGEGKLERGGLGRGKRLRESERSCFDAAKGLKEKRKEELLRGTQRKSCVTVNMQQASCQLFQRIWGFKIIEKAILICTLGFELPETPWCVWEPETTISFYRLLQPYLVIISSWISKECKQTPFMFLCNLIKWEHGLNKAKWYTLFCKKRKTEDHIDLVPGWSEQSPKFPVLS